jgi:hypothetical protein
MDADDIDPAVSVSVSVSVRSFQQDIDTISTPKKNEKCDPSDESIQSDIAVQESCVKRCGQGQQHEDQCAICLSSLSADGPVMRTKCMVKNVFVLNCGYRNPLLMV